MPAIECSYRHHGEHMSCFSNRSFSTTSWRQRVADEAHKSNIPREPESNLTTFEVLLSQVVVRAEPSTTANALGMRRKGDTIVAEAVVNGWAQLCDGGWMLIDGSSMGVGMLLREVSVPPPASLRATELLCFTDTHITLRSGLVMPLIGLGTGGVPGLEGEECVRLVRHGITKCGVRLIDSAADYHNEEAVGQAIRSCGVPRSELFVCTKFGPLSQGYEAARASVQRSLQRMHLEYLDCVFIHWPGAWIQDQRDWSPHDWLGGRGVALARDKRAGSYRALEDLKAEGKIRTIGISNYTPTHLMELLQGCRVHPDILQSEHHPFFSNQAVRKLCEVHGIAFMAYGPLSGGHAERKAGQKGVHNEVVREIALEAGRSAAQVVLRWATQRGVAVLPKSHRTAGIEENAALDFRLSDSQMRRLDSLETGNPVYWDPRCVDQLDHFNIFLDKDKLRKALGGT